MKLRSILYNLISILFRFIPRDKHLWVTGKISDWGYEAVPPVFFDNSKYFFLFLVNNTKERVYWISSSKSEIEMLNKMNLPVVKFPSIKGLFLVLRAKFSFHHYGPDQINTILQRGSIQLDFWHGTPLKKIRYDVIGKPIIKSNIYYDIMKKGGEEYVFSTSKFLSDKILKNAFLVDDDKLLNFGYPRMDVLGLSKEDNKKFCKKYSPNLLKYIDCAEKFDKVFLYMPTYRDYDSNYLEKSDLDFTALNNALKTINGVFFLKLHPLTKHIEINKYKNIILIDNDVDIYPFLIYTNYLITDFSSIFFDYLVLNKEIFFIPFDFNKYTENRQLYFDYDEIIPGKKFLNFKCFIDELPCIDKIDYSKKRKKIYDLFIENYNFKASENTYKYFKEKYFL